MYVCMRSCDISVSIVSYYRLYDWVLIFGREKIFFLRPLCPYTILGPPSPSIGCRGSFAGGIARPWRDADNSPQPVPRSIMSRRYSSHSWRLHGCSETTLLLLLLFMCMCDWVYVRVCVCVCVCVLACICIEVLKW
jgi:hypothetical protein